MSSPRFAGKVAIVTGAAQGIGRDVAVRIAAEGGQSRAGRSFRTGAGGVRRRCRSRRAWPSAIKADLETFSGASSHGRLRAAEAAQAHRHARSTTSAARSGQSPTTHYAEEQIEAEIRRSLFPDAVVLPRRAAGDGGAQGRGDRQCFVRRDARHQSRALCGGERRRERNDGLSGHGIRRAWHPRQCDVAPGGTEAPPRRIPRNAAQPTAQEKAWYQGIVDQTIEQQSDAAIRHAPRSRSRRSCSSPPMRLPTSPAVLPVGGGDLG